MNGQTVALNQLPTINCPSGNMYVCGTYFITIADGVSTIKKTIVIK